MMPALRLFGGIMKGTLAVVTSAIQIALSPLELFSSILKGFDMKGMGTIIGAGGTLFLLATRFHAIRNAIMGVNAALLVTIRRIMFMVAPLLAVEDMIANFTGKDSLSGRVEKSMTPEWLRNSTLTKAAKYSTGNALGMRNLVEIVVNTVGLQYLVNVTVDNKDQSSRANALSQLGG